jgi:spermidine synthase
MVDLSPSVFELARTVFREANLNVMESGKAHRVVEDGSHFIRFGEGSYDVIAADPYGPRYPGSAKLYSREFLEDCRSRLTERGAMILWTFREGVRQDTFKTALKTFLQVFPETSVWYTPEGKSFFFVGWKQKPAKRMPEDLKRYSWMSAPEAAAFVEKTETTETLKRPRLEFLIERDRSKRMTAAWMKRRVGAL